MQVSEGAAAAGRPARARQAGGGRSRAQAGVRCTLFPLLFAALLGLLLALLLGLLPQRAAAQSAPAPALTCSVSNGCVFAPQRERWLIYSAGRPLSEMYFASPQAACTAFAQTAGYTFAQMIFYFDGHFWRCGFPVGGGVMITEGAACPVLAEEVNAATGSLLISPAERILGCCYADQRIIPSSWPESIWYRDPGAWCTIRGKPVPERHAGPPSSCAGNPIDAVLGTKYQRERDLARAVLGEPFVRSYQSGAAGARFTAFGSGWQHSWGQRLRVGASAVDALRADGQIVQFALRAGRWVSWADEPATLEEQKDAQGQRLGWRLVSAQGDVEDYEAGGRIVQLARPDGRSASFTMTPQAI